MTRETALQKYIRWACTPRVFTEGEIVRGMRGALHKAQPGPFDKPTPAQLLERAQALALLDLLADNPRPITPEHTAKGLAWFDAMHVASHKPVNGDAMHWRREWRNTRQTRQFNDRHRAIVDSFERFLFTGYLNNGNAYRDWYLPCYRVIGAAGEFEYCYGSWQNGDTVQFVESRERVAA